MKSDSSPEVDSDVFDSIIAQCVRELEQGKTVDCEALCDQYPQWSDDIREFLADWGQFDQYSAAVKGHRDRLDRTNTPGSHIKYFGDYELIEEIGFGGMGVIYRAKQISLDRLVAIKMILDPRQDRRRFQIEAEAAAKLDHSNIVSIYEVGQHSGHPYFSMQLIEGDDLATVLKQGPMTNRDAAELVQTLAAAIHYAHQRGVLHRDLKPANILIDQRGTPFVTDFGLAKQVGEDSESLTMTHAVLGTPGYMSPEQASTGKAEITVRTDVYGLGAILFSTLTGEAPFQGDSSLEVIRKVTERPAKFPPNHSVDRDLETICLKCLDKSIDRRYSSASALEKDLSRYLNGVPISARPVSTARRILLWYKRNPVNASLFALAIVLLMIAGIAVLLWGRSENLSRIAAEKNSHRESVLKDRIDRLHKLEIAAREKAERTLVESYVDNGFDAHFSERDDQAFLWNAAAANLSIGIPERHQRDVRRSRLWSEKCPRLVAATLDRNLRHVAFDSSGQWLLAWSADSKADRVLDLSRGFDWALDEIVPDHDYAIWINRPGIMAVVSYDKKLHLIDCELKRVLSSISLERMTRVVAAGNQTNVLAVALGTTVHMLNSETLEPLRSPFDLPLTPYTLGISLDDKFLISHCSSGNIALHQWESENAEVPVLNAKSHLEYLGGRGRQAFRPHLIDGRYLIAKSNTEIEFRELKRINVGKDKIVNSIPLGAAYGLSNLSDSGRFVVGGKYYARVREMNGRGHQEILRHRDRVHRIAIRRDGSAAATAGWDNRVRLWDLSDLPPTHDKNLNQSERRPVATLAHQELASNVAFSRDGSRLATVQYDGLVRVWDIQHLIAKSTNVPVGPLGSLLRRTDEGESFYTAGGTFFDNHLQALRVYDFTGQSKHSCSFPGIVVRDAAKSSSKNQYGVITVEDIGMTRQSSLRIESGGLLHLVHEDENGDLFSRQVLKMPSEPASVDFHPLRQELAVFCLAGEVLIIDTQLGEVKLQSNIESLNLHVGEENVRAHIKYTPNGKSIVIWGTYGVHLQILDAETLDAKCAPIKNNERSFRDVAISADSQWLVYAGGSSQHVGVIRVADGKRLVEPIEHPALVYSVDTSWDSRRFITSCGGGQVRVFDLAKSGGKAVHVLHHDRDVLDAKLTSDGNRVITISQDRVLRVWDVKSGEPLWRKSNLEYGSRWICVAKDDRHVAVSGSGKNAQIIQIDTEPANALLTPAQMLMEAELLTATELRDGKRIPMSASRWEEKYRQFQPRFDSAKSNR